VFKFKNRNFLFILSMILFFSLFSYFTSFVEAKAEGDVAKAVSVEKIFEIYSKGDSFFVDARAFKEYKKGHIEGAINIPYHSDKKEEYILKAIDMLNGAKYVVVYCDGSGCDLSKMLAKDLVNAGLKKEKLIVFTEGFNLWEKKGFPVSKDLSFQKVLFSQE